MRGTTDQFFLRKVGILNTLIQQQGKLENVLEEPMAADDRERCLHGLAGEIHFTEFMQCESFFAFLVAIHQPLPHWVYLSEYTTRDIHVKMRAFLDGDFEGLTDGRFKTEIDLVMATVYAGLRPNGALEAPWTENLKSIAAVIRRVTPKYLKRIGEFNAYKHGLRVISASASLTITPSGSSPGAGATFLSPHSITHLEFTNKPEGRAVSIATKRFNPDESEVHIMLMSEVLRVAKGIRPALSSGEPQIELASIAQSIGTLWTRCLCIKTGRFLLERHLPIRIVSR